jgi:translation initiation factor IF-1
VVCDPVNVSEEGQEAEVEDEEEGKGKVVVTERDTVKVTARLSERGGIDVRVRIGRGDSVKVLARMVAEGSDVCLSLFLIPRFPAVVAETTQRRNTNSSPAAAA